MIIAWPTSEPEKNWRTAEGITGAGWGQGHVEPNPAPRPNAQGGNRRGDFDEGSLGMITVVTPANSKA